MGGERMEPVTIVDKRGRRKHLRRVMDAEEYERVYPTLEVPQPPPQVHGVKLEDMTPDQLKLAEQWTRDQAGRLWWQAQAATDPAQAEGYMELRARLIAAAADAGLVLEGVTA